ncbi:magnesium transporter [Reinekea marinisedimentorum]|uniref:Magnesium transporter MgtE n=1 Tax=Reinekea marinisedimentorum TaxID=230495 RepID=A0A4R3HWU9_9GAMM|nr:magnesium transporter [Reinekea marinisedimentorum]TCS37618.1 magnesium transporter [Reinekea marinisedimentorum]
MQTVFDETEFDKYKSIVQQALDSGNFVPIDRLFNEELSVVDLAHLLESTPSKVRMFLWSFIDEIHQGDVLSYLNDEIRQALLGKMSAEEIVETTQDIESDDLADMLQQMPPEVSNRVLQLMPSDDRSEVEGLLVYPEDTAGGLMNTDVVAIRADVTVETVLRYLRKLELPDSLDMLWVTDRDSHYKGSLALPRLLTTAADVTIADIMSTTIKAIDAYADEEHVAQIFERQDLISAPVVNGEGILIGRITIDDVVDVIIENADHSILGMAGLDEEDDVFAPAIKSSQDRAVWLGINMATAFIAAAVMSRFEASIAEIVALAVLSPVVASMGGIAGSQTLTLIIRGMATGHVTRSNLSWMILRELGVGLINGSLWAIVIGSITVIWYHSFSLALVIAAAILVNICLAVLSGTLLPFILKSAKIDPALSGSVILTTLTDVFGFLTFLGLATAFLL